MIGKGKKSVRPEDGRARELEKEQYPSGFVAQPKNKDRGAMTFILKLPEHISKEGYMFLTTLHQGGATIISCWKIANQMLNSTLDADHNCTLLVLKLYTMGFLSVCLTEYKIYCANKSLPIQM